MRAEMNANAAAAAAAAAAASANASKAADNAEVARAAAEAEAANAARRKANANTAAGKKKAEEEAAAANKKLKNAAAAAAKKQAEANAALQKAHKAIAKSVYNKVPLKNTNIPGTKTPKSNNHEKILANIAKIRNSNTNFNTYINSAINSIQKNNTGFGVGRFAKRNANFEYRKKLAKRIVQSLRNGQKINNLSVRLN
jgi:membrane protein involved in colicin uptake